MLADVNFSYTLLCQMLPEQLNVQATGGRIPFQNSSLTANFFLLLISAASRLSSPHNYVEQFYDDVRLPLN